MRSLLMTKKKQPTKWGPLCFTAETAGATVQLTSTWSPTVVSLETSTDWNTWTAYTIGNTITLTNIWDKVYFRNTSETDTTFSLSYNNNYYRFKITGDVAWSGDVTYLLNKNWTTTVSNYCFAMLFYSANLTAAPELPATTLWQYCYYQMFSRAKITTPPELPATTLASYCYDAMFSNSELTTCPELPATNLRSNFYNSMFKGCSNLNTLPSLPATTLINYCYYQMFQNCTKIKLSQTQTWAYQTEYRIPTEWTWTTASYALNNMISNTGWTFTSTPSINTTYYTSNTII